MEMFLSPQLWRGENNRFYIPTALPPLQAGGGCLLLCWRVTSLRIILYAEITSKNIRPEPHLVESHIILLKPEGLNQFTHLLRIWPVQPTSAPAYTSKNLA